MCQRRDKDWLKLPSTVRNTVCAHRGKHEGRFTLFHP